MIHQLIFASPKPGMTESAFQEYWVNVHALQYASKIVQIRRYMVDTRVPFAGEVLGANGPLFGGVAEIWIKEEEQLASLESKEFIDGARHDEPNWAAFWRTIGIDTDAHILAEGTELSRDSGMIKLLTLVKRREGVPLPVFRSYSLAVHAALALAVPGLRRYWQCHTRDSAYAIGEPMFDAVFLSWFDDLPAAETMLAGAEYMRASDDLDTFAELRYRHTMACREHWIIGPEFR
jgi:hypothetical protein